MGNVGYHGHPVLNTPDLDQMAATLEEWQRSVLGSLNGKDYR